MALADWRSGRRARSKSPISRREGFTIVEVAIVVAIIGLLAVISGSSYLSYIEKVRVASAIASIRAIAVEFDDFVRSEKPLPASLAEIGLGDKRDPWGNKFEYLPFPTTAPGAGGGDNDGGANSSGSAGGGGGGNPSGNGNAGGSAPIGGSYLGSARKDHFLVPLNSDYDLYSVGKDGKSRAPLSAPDSADDVIRANDGAYIGLAAHY